MNIADIHAKLGLDTKDFDRGLKSAQSGFSKLTQSAMQLNQSFELMAKGFRVFESIGNTMLEAGLKAERLDTAFKSIFKDTKAAQDEMNFLQRTADDLGQEFYALAEGYKGIAAASKGTTMEGQATRDIFLAVTQAGTALKMTNEEIDGSLRAVAQMMSKGTVQAEELRGQLGERLPGAFQLAAKSMGMTTAELGKALEQGQVMSDVMLPRLAAVLSHTYGDAALEAAKSTQASINRMVNAWERLKLNFSNSEFMEGFAKAVDAVADQLTDPEVQRQMRELGNSVGKLAERFSTELVPSLNNAVEAMRELNSLWDSIPATVKGMVTGAAIGSRAGAWGAIIGGLGGGLTGYELGKSTQEQIDDTWARIQRLEERVRSGPSILERAIGIDQATLDDTLTAARARLKELYWELAREEAGLAKKNAGTAAAVATMLGNKSNNAPAPTFNNPLKLQLEGAERTVEQLARIEAFRKQHDLLAGGIPEWQQASIKAYNEQAEALEKQLLTQQEELQLLQWKQQGLSENEIILKQINREYDNLTQQWPEFAPLVEELRKGAIEAENLKQALDLGNNQNFAEGWNAGIREIEDGLKSMGEMGKQVALDMSQTMADTFSDVFGEAIDGNIRQWHAYVTDFLKSVSKAIFSMLSQQAATSIMGMMGFAQGGVFNNGNVIPFAHGGINPGIPQFFPMASGSVGLWGEAGPEAILPLTRLPGGDLGVQANVGSGIKELNIQLFNEGGQELQASRAERSFDMQREIIRIWMDGVANNVEGSADFIGLR